MEKWKGEGKREIEEFDEVLRKSEKNKKRKKEEGLGFRVILDCEGMTSIYIITKKIAK